MKNGGERTSDLKALAVAAVLSGALVIGVTVMALRYPFAFTRGVTTDHAFRGVMTAFVMVPLPMVAFWMSRRLLSLSAFFGVLAVSSFFASLLIHEALFGSKLPEKAYQEPLFARVVLVGTMLSVIALLPAGLACLLSRQTEERRSRSATLE